MIEFLKDPSLWIEVLALVASFYFLRRGNPKPFLPLRILLVLVVVVEMTATTLRFLDINNTNLYNSFIIIWFELFFLSLFQYLENKSFKRITGIFIAAFFIFGILDLTKFSLGFWVAHRTFIIGSMLLSTSAIFVMVELVSKPVFINILKEPFFWVSISILAYFLPMSIFMGANEYFKGNPTPSGILYFTSFIRSVKILNFIHYILLIIAFYCHHQKEKEGK